MPLLKAEELRPKMVLDVRDTGPVKINHSNRHWNVLVLELVPGLMVYTSICSLPKGYKSPLAKLQSCRQYDKACVLEPQVDMPFITHDSYVSYWRAQKSTLAELMHLYEKRHHKLPQSVYQRVLVGLLESKETPEGLKSECLQYLVKKRIDPHIEWRYGDALGAVVDRLRKAPEKEY